VTNIVKSVTNILTELIKNEPGLIAILKPGDLVEGKVLDKSAKMMLLDLGKHGTGVVYRGELINARGMVKDLKVGDSVHAKVIDVDNEDGLVELSLAEAGKQKAWGEIQELQAKDEAFSVKVLNFNRGGLTADISGILAFLPVSQLAGDHYPKVTAGDKAQVALELQKLIGLEIEVKIIDINPRTNKLIISERAAVELSAKELSKNYEVGQVIEGLVSGVADFGAFIKFTDNPAVEGLIHVSELDYRIVDNPKEVVRMDEVVKAKIIDIKEGKISLSLKALKTDPWLSAKEKYAEGQEVKGTIYVFNPFGAIVSLEGGLQGQVHVTEFGGVEEMKKNIVSGKEYVFVIESVKPEERRITLKLKK
jgi:small subunit ribosomal protein S1